MFVMQGPRLDELQRASDTLAEQARKIPGLVDVDTSLRTGKPEVSVRLDRPKAADLGVQGSDAAEALRLLVGGDQVTTYNEAGEQYEVHLRAEGQNRDSEAAIGRLTVPSARLGSVPLENIASFARGEAAADIRRLNRQRQVTVSANMLPGTSQSTAQTQMSEAAAQARAGVRVPNGLLGAVARAEPDRQRVPCRRSRCRSSSCTSCWPRSSSRGCTR